ncbi:Co-chaperone HscB, C-terminal oligomerization domain-containing protein [Truncatella angustata]|uniref:Co-chaperone HscB, C-terminal oligomerization domain-containing protein n=1 Tax=Truncatella angustata TaxID=152316 RepID=A0A9P8UEA8_9PEZI|nr:Co-chaperone HscB, C-terminal oligomerization domain-containing protein [Truncatella angustata]KAH6648342.1 Co-chaperone HscB, C-terminal oligomerization domain-containing protein [Truncatella angustata]KAH8201639.1 hypothetical protein TruAng_004160 [Truncatella angustata]
MRTSLLPHGRQLSRVCDACKRQQRSFSVSASSPSRTATPTRDAPPRRANALRSFMTPQTAARTITTTRAPRSAETADAPASRSPTSPAPSTAVPQTHYEFFPQSLPQGPPPSGPFGVDVRALRREFLQLQGRAHPDLHPPQMKSRAEATSARINEAFRTLSSPLLRAQYLLSLRGLDVANDETAKVEDPELLMEVLEAREEIEEAAEESELEPLRARNAEREEESIAELEKCFTENDLEGAMRECVRLRYWVNIRESINNWEPGKPVVLEH